MDRAFKKNEKVKYITPGVPFIETKTDSIKWLYGDIVFSGETKGGASYVYIKNSITKDIERISTFSVFKLKLQVNTLEAEVNNLISKQTELVQILTSVDAEITSIIWSIGGSG